MKLDHVAIWAVDIELMRTFYEKYFDARSNLKYQNERAIPIVVTFVADPVGSGLVASLARPGGNITGLSTLAAGLVAKRLELLRDSGVRVQPPTIID